jgi:expansin (peptidoglycan-binding protein)
VDPEEQRDAPVVRRWRWVAGGGAAVLAAVIGVAVALQATGAPACASPGVAAVPAGTATHSGIATYYTTLGVAGNLGNCGFPAPPADNLYVALSPSEYAAAGACGAYLDVTGRKGTVRVKVVDQCPECATGHLDLSRQAFARIDDPVKGQVSIRYRAVVNPRLAAPMSFVVKDGSSRWWLAVLVDDHGNPLSSVEVKAGSGWRALARQGYNYWLAASGAGNGPFTLRIRDVYGHGATVSRIALSPGAVQRSGVRLYGAGSGGPVAASPKRGAPSRTPARMPASAVADPSPAGMPAQPAVAGVTTPRACR